MQKGQGLKDRAPGENGCVYHEHTENVGANGRTGCHNGPALQDANGFESKVGSNGKLPAGEHVSRIRKFFYHAVRLVLGAVFLYASFDKILHPEAFAQAVYNYQILPDAAVNVAALTLPWLELLLGLCLVSGFWLPGATIVSSGLLAVFIGALIFNQVRGLDVHCGCFSTETTEGPAGLLTVLRDVSFLAMSVLLTWWVFFAGPHDSKAPVRNQSTR